MGFGSRWSGGGVVLAVVVVCEFELCCAVCEEARFFGFSLLYFGGEKRRLALGSFDSIPPLAFFCKSSCLLWLFEREKDI